MQRAFDWQSARSREMTPANPELTKFWKALPNATWSEDGKVLTLADDTHFPGCSPMGNQLVVRECYEKLEEEMKEFFANKGWAMGVIGNESIGKTFLGLYLLYKWAVEGRRVVWCGNVFLGDRPTLFCKEGVFRLEGKLCSFHRELGQDDVRVVVDGIDPAEIGYLRPRAKTVVLALPDTKGSRRMEKESGATFRYMGPWSLEELEYARGTIFRDVQEVDMLALYDRFGGLPRWVLEQADAKEKHYDIENDIPSFQVMDIVTSSKTTRSGYPGWGYSNYLLITDPESETSWRVNWASPYMAELAARRAWVWEHDRLQDYLRGLFRGYGAIDWWERHEDALQIGLWEGLRHHLLSKGGNFREWELQPQKVAKQEDLGTEVSGNPAKLVPKPEIQGLNLPGCPTRVMLDGLSGVKPAREGEYCTVRGMTEFAITQSGVFVVVGSSRPTDSCLEFVRRVVESMVEEGSLKVSVFFVVLEKSAESGTQWMNLRIGLDQLCQELSLEPNVVPRVIEFHRADKADW